MNPDLLRKYPHIAKFKNRELMTVQERRWKGVRAECKPKELYEVEVKLGHIKVEAAVHEEEKEDDKRKPNEMKEIVENITVI